MPGKPSLVINTGPTLGIIAACGDLGILKHLYEKIFMPQEVAIEIGKGGSSGFGIAEVEAADWIQKMKHPCALSPILRASLDLGEAAVIQTAIDLEIPTVAIDEMIGRKIAKICGLKVTGSLGILIRAKECGVLQSMKDAITNMQARNIYLSKRLIDSALQKTNEYS